MSCSIYLIDIVNERLIESMRFSEKIYTFDKIVNTIIIVAAQEQD